MPLSAEVDRVRTRVELKDDHVRNTSSSAYPGTYPGVDDSWSLDSFKENFKVQFVSMNDDRSEIEFDLIGVDAAIANAVRRILLAEIPTMAIEQCFIFDNTSIIPDELLSHRLGLIPLKVDPRLFKFRVKGELPTEEDTIVFKLEVTCEGDVTHSKVFSGDLKWLPQGDQEEVHTDGIKPVHDDILLAKMRPGQAIRIELHCAKGYGKEHAKWSPVGTASYRLMPDIELTQEVTGEKARRLQACFAKGVIALESTADGDVRAKVANPRLCTMSREVFRHPDLVDLVRVQRIRDHFIFSVESTGSLPADVLVKEAFKVLKEKGNAVKAELEKLEAPSMES